MTGSFQASAARGKVRIARGKVRTAREKQLGSTVALLMRGEIQGRMCLEAGGAGLFKE